MCYFQREVQDSVGWVDKADPPNPSTEDFDPSPLETDR